MEIKNPNPVKKKCASCGNVGILAIFAVGVFFFYFYQPANDSERHDKIFCTQEAKLCQDGSAVGRTGPNCEFAECPTNGDGKLEVRGEIDTSTWKTYRNEKYGFEVKYPSGWEVGYDNPNAMKRDNFTFVRMIADPSHSISIQVTPPKIDRLDGTQLQILIEEEVLGFLSNPTLQVIKIKTGGQSGVYVIRRQDFDIYVSDKSKTAERGNYRAVEIETIEQILSTFRFSK